MRVIQKPLDDPWGDGPDTEEHGTCDICQSNYGHGEGVELVYDDDTLVCDFCRHAATCDICGEPGALPSREGGDLGAKICDTPSCVIEYFNQESAWRDPELCRGDRVAFTRPRGLVGQEQLVGEVIVITVHEGPGAGEPHSYVEGWTFTPGFASVEVKVGRHTHIIDASALLAIIKGDD